MMSVKQMGHEVIKRRRMQLVEPLPAGSDKAFCNTLCAMMGIKNATFDGKCWEISYDLLLEATADQFERTITDFGANLGGGWSEKTPPRVRALRGGNRTAEPGKRGRFAFPLPLMNSGGVLTHT